MAENEHDVLDYEAGKPRVLSERCSTCVFRPGNPMNLEPGRLADLIEHNRRAGAGLTCHQTLPYADTNAEPAWCRGFYDSYPDAAAIQFAHRVLGGVVEVDPPK